MVYKYSKNVVTPTLQKCPRFDQKYSEECFLGSTEIVFQILKFVVCILYTKALGKSLRIYSGRIMVHIITHNNNNNLPNNFNLFNVF